MQPSNADTLAVTALANPAMPRDKNDPLALVVENRTGKMQTDVVICSPEMLLNPNMGGERFVYGHSGLPVGHNHIVRSLYESAKKHPLSIRKVSLQSSCMGVLLSKSISIESTDERGRAVLQTVTCKAVDSVLSNTAIRERRSTEARVCALYENSIIRIGVLLPNEQVSLVFYEMA